jgi:predicted ATPase/DNA-binding winged helix-turn-helix (wHTH) protein
MHTMDVLPAALRFGRCELLPHHRELRVDGKPVQLGGRAFDLLMALVEGRGKLVTKDEILSRVWPGIIIEENTLQVQISALRKAMGTDRDSLKTISGRGYRFIADVTTINAQAEADSERAVVSGHVPRTLTNLAAPATELIGRESELSEVLALTMAHRLVTLIGVGGIGKTRLAVEAARQLLPTFADGVWVVELASLSDPDLVPLTVAQALGFDLEPVSPSHIAAALASKHALIVLDNCEHVIDAAASMAEALLRANSATRVIVTSREPLRAEGERIFRVPPLGVPAEGTENVQDLLQYSAVKLFMARACSADQTLSDVRIAAAAAAICRSLDGIPLAIELAAVRVPALGIEALASRLDDRFTLLSHGRRTALPRHQTLRASLHWSYDLLSASERLVLQRLSLFSGGFTLEAASSVAASSDIDAPTVVECVSNLVSKSLVTAHLADAATQYSLLHTTRAYAREKLTESGELHEIAHRHKQGSSIQARELLAGRHHLFVGGFEKSGLEIATTAPVVDQALPRRSTRTLRRASPMGRSRAAVNIVQECL